MDKDQYDEQAMVALHECPAQFRTVVVPAVAAALRKSRDYWLTDLRIAEATNYEKDDQIDALKAKLAELRKFAEDYPCHCAQHYPSTTAYHGHDCENVVVQEFIEQWLSRAEMEKKP